MTAARSSAWTCTGGLVAVGLYVSVVCGQQNYMENAVFASAA
jgi:hypothetical protein